MVRALAYRRVSTKAQGEKYSLDTQLDGIKTFCQEQGIEIVETYTDVHTGVELWERPALTQMRERVRAKEVDCVVAYTIDRLARDPVHLGVVLTEARHYGVEVLFVRDEVDDTPEGQLISFVRGFAAKIEHAQTRERTMRGKKAMLDSGKFIRQGHDPYGYDVVFDEERRVWLFTPNAQAENVRQIYRWLLEGRSINAILRELHRLGLPSPAAVRDIVYKDGRVPTWTRRTVRNILTNTVYKGEVYNNKVEVTKEEGKRKVRKRPRAEWVRVQNVEIEPLVSPADWERAQERRRANRSSYTRNAKSDLKYLLRGRITCSVCGGPMYADLNNTSRYGVTDQSRIYRCSSRKRGAFGKACGAKLINALRVEGWVIDELIRLFSNEDLIREQLERRRSIGPDQQLKSERDGLVAQVTQAENRLERLRYDLRDEEDARLRAFIREDIKLLLGQQDALKERIAEIDRQIENEKNVLQNIESFTEYVRRVRVNLENADFEMKRKVVEALDLTIIGHGREWRMVCTALDGNGPMDIMSTNIIRFTVSSTHGPLIEIVQAA